MPEVTIELDDRVHVNTCTKCGTDFPRVHGFLYLDGDAWAVYWAELYKQHPGHPETRAVLVIALGKDWSEEADPAEHFWATIDVWPSDDEIQMAFIDPYGTLSVARFGQPLSREDALAHPWRKVFLACADKVVQLDKRVSQHLDA